MYIYWTYHARAQLSRRTGLSRTQADERILEALRSDKFYTPSFESDCAWIPVDGHKGKGAAIIKFEDDGPKVLTVRESETCEQGEGAFRGSGFTPLARNAILAKLLEKPGNLAPLVSK